MFPEIPENLGELRDEAIAARLDASREIAKDADALEALFASLTDGDDAMSADDAKAHIESGVEGIERLQAELEARQPVPAPDFAELADRIPAELADDAEVVETEIADEDTDETAEVTEDAPADETVEVEIVVEDEAVEPVVAAAPARKSAPAPAVVRDERQWTAQTDIPGTTPGTKMDIAEVAQAVRDRLKSGVSDRAYVAKTQPNTQGSFTSEPAQNAALVAAVCAPAEAVYDLCCHSDDIRPLANCLPSYSASRGKVSVPVSTPIADFAGAITVNPGEGEEKACIPVPCPESVEYEVIPTAACLCFDNLSYMSWPEYVEDALCKTMAIAARAAETAILDTIAAASTPVTAPAYGGAQSTLIGHIAAAAAGYRSRNRMAPGSRLSAIFPAWVKELLIADQARQIACCGDSIESYLNEIGIDACFYVDEATGSDQIFPSPAGAVLDAFPATVQWYLFAPGTFLHIAGPSLDLGIQRSPESNKTNSACLFSEFWETVAHTGCESLCITSDVCASGALSAPVDIDGSCPVA